MMADVMFESAPINSFDGDALSLNDGVYSACKYEIYEQEELMMAHHDGQEPECNHVSC